MFYVRGTHSCFYSLPDATRLMYDKAVQELQVQDALEAYKKANPEKDFVAMAIDNVLEPERCPHCNASYNVRPVFTTAHSSHRVHTALHATFVTPCTLPCIAHSSHRVHCLACHIRHTVYTASYATLARLRMCCHGLQHVSN